jgi:serine/threonine-protein kinase
MGVVYKVRDPKTLTPYAAKVLHPRLLSAKDFVKRFKTEAKTAAHLKHLNTVHAFKLKGWEGTLYYIMEFVDGPVLEEILRRSGALPCERALAIARDVAAGLAYIHSKSYVHRDVKPGNVLVRPDDHVKLIDFGLAQRCGIVTRTKSGHVMGTAKYMAPELIDGTDARPETDIYSLGIMTYEMLTGKAPFDCQDADMLMDMQLYSKHRPLCDAMKGADIYLGEFLDRMLAKKMKERIADARTVQGWFDFYVTNGWFAPVPKNA